MTGERADTTGEDGTTTGRREGGAGGDEAGTRGTVTGEDGGGAEVPAVALTLDCLGLKCPLPVIRLAQRIGDVAVGAIVRVLADDPAAANDIPAWCRMKGQEFRGSPEMHAFDVRRIG